jgi:WD40 repeat protein
MNFKAFISYSHGADGKLAPAVQRALHRIAKPWYRLRTMRVFRDQTNLAASPGLWSSIEDALNQAEYFIYLASPQAAKSTWVQKEIEWWLSNRSAGKLLIVLTDGELAWSASAGDWEWEKSPSWPAAVKRAFGEEPLYTDLRWARKEEQLSPRHSQFRAAILDLAATLLGRPKDELDGDDVRQYRRTRRIAGLAIGVLAVLFAAASLAAYLATQQSRLASSRALGARSEALLPTRPELALLLAREAVRIQADAQAEFALRQAFVRNPRYTLHQARASADLTAVFASPEILIAGDSDQGSAVWSVQSGKRLATLEGVAGANIHTGAGEFPWLLVNRRADSFVVLGGQAWKQIAELPGAGAMVSGDGSLVVANDGGKLRRWQLPGLKEHRPAISVSAGHAVRAVSAEGRYILLADDSQRSDVVVVDAIAARPVAVIRDRILHEGQSLSPDGKMLVAVSPHDQGAVELWDIRNGRKLLALEMPDMGAVGWITHTAFTPDSRQLFIGNRNGDLLAWETATGKFIRAWTQHRNDIRKIAFSPDGQNMLSASVDGTVCLWDTGSGRCLATFGGQGDDAWDCGFSGDNLHFFTTHVDGTARIWRRDTWHPDLVMPGGLMALSEDTKIAVTAAESTVAVWDPLTGKDLGRIELERQVPKKLAVSSAASMIAVLPENAPVRLFRVSSGELIGTLPEAAVNSTALAFSKDGRELLTGEVDGAIRFWSTSNFQSVREWPPGVDTVTQILVDGDEVTIVSEIGSAQRRSAVTGELIKATTAVEELTTEVTTAGPRRALLVVMNYRYPELWSLATGTRMMSLPGHSDDVLSAAFGPEGRFLLTGTGYLAARGMPPDDGNSIHLWDHGTGRRLLTYRSAGWAIDQLFVGSDGTTVFSASRDGRIRRHRCDVCLPLPQLQQLIDSRLTRQLTEAERAAYIP